MKAENRRLGSKKKENTIKKDDKTCKEAEEQAEFLARYPLDLIRSLSKKNEKEYV